MTEKTALQTAQKFQVDAAATGFEWDHIDQIFEKLTEEINEVKQGIEHQDQNNIEEEIGDVLFVAVNLAKNLGIDAETALKKANNKFEKRYDGMFELFKQKYPNINTKDLTLEQWDELWNKQKELERTS